MNILAKWERSEHEELKYNKNVKKKVFWWLTWRTKEINHNSNFLLRNFFRICSASTSIKKIRHCFKHKKGGGRWRSRERVTSERNNKKFNLKLSKNCLPCRSEEVIKMSSLECNFHILHMWASTSLFMNVSEEILTPHLNEI